MLVAHALQTRALCARRARAHRRAAGPRHAPPPPPPSTTAQVWDLGGQSSIRPYWRCYYPNTDAIIFVVDSADSERVETARAELHAMLEEEDLKDAILLVFANKQDMMGSLKAPALSEALGLAAIKNRQWTIQETSATEGKGLTAGFDWLVQAIANKVG